MISSQSFFYKRILVIFLGFCIITPHAEVINTLKSEYNTIYLQKIILETRRSKLLSGYNSIFLIPIKISNIFQKLFISRLFTFTLYLVKHTYLRLINPPQGDPLKLYK